MRSPIVFYHIACSWPETRYSRPATKWREIVKEQIQQWKQSELIKSAYFYIGINGTREEYDEACSMLPNISYCWYNGFDAAWEIPTINRMVEIIKDISDDTPICYHHTKGVSWCKRDNIKWRQAMQWYCIENWEKCIEYLKDVDACGAFLRIDKRWNPHFAGNFFWAKSEYLKTLPRITDQSLRVNAELWINSNNNMTAVNFTGEQRNLKKYSMRTFKNSIVAKSANARR